MGTFVCRETLYEYTKKQYNVYGKLYMIVFDLHMGSSYDFFIRYDSSLIVYKYRMHSFVHFRHFVTTFISLLFQSV